MAMKEKALRRLADKLNAAGVTWAAGGEWLLSFRGITDSYHVFDIFVAEEHAEKADKVLTRLGMRSAVESTDAFRAEYHFDGADIHVRVGIPGFHFGADQIFGDAQVLGAVVHLISPEAALQLAALEGSNTAAWERYADLSRG